LIATNLFLQEDIPVVVKLEEELEYITPPSPVSKELQEAKTFLANLYPATPPPLLSSSKFKMH